jgi:hypothetical protein
MSRRSGVAAKADSPQFLAQMHASFACVELRLGRTFGPATTRGVAVNYGRLQYFSTP